LGATLFRTENRFLDALVSAPNPKPSVVDKAKFGQLASLYTAFSQAFAAEILDLCMSEGCEAIADPFSGMGTLGEAARTRPVNLQLGDISPFAVLSGTFRTSTREEIIASTALVRDLSEAIDAQDERAYFSQLLHALGAGAEDATKHVLEAPTEPENRATALAIYLAALSRLRLHKSFAGSNPTWIKRSSAAADREATRLAVDQTLAGVVAYATGLEPLDVDNRTTVRWAALSEQRYRPASLDAIITSPPYPNRTDYFRHYLPASELLLNAAGQDERSLRLEQIGTPLIRATDQANALPENVSKLISQIRAHGSYASERYYYKGFLYYFSDMAAALDRMKEWLRPGGILVFVVQDTYYKDIPVPVADLLIDLAAARDFSLIGRQDWRVRHTLSRLSPHSRRSVPNRAASESVIAFSR
jgi:hypothetical protein